MTSFNKKPRITYGSRMMITTKVVILIIAFFGLSCTHARQTQESSEDEEAIRNLILERIEKFNNKHEEPQSAAFTHDADFVNVYGMWRRGPAEIEGRQGNA
jgi:hypothetical protein